MYRTLQGFGVALWFSFIRSRGRERDFESPVTFQTQTFWWQHPPLALVCNEGVGKMRLYRFCLGVFREGSNTQVGAVSDNLERPRCKRGLVMGDKKSILMSIHE